MFGKKMRGKTKVLSVFLALALALSFAGVLGPAPVLAADPTTEFDLYIDSSWADTITASDIDSSTNYKLVHYSGLSNKDPINPAYYSARGVELADLLAPYVPSGKSLNSANTEIIITSNDTLSKTFYGNDLFGTTRYYYPNGGGSTVVYPLIATSDAASITANPADFGSGDALRFYYGQANSTDKNIPNWVKTVEKIEVNFN